MDSSHVAYTPQSDATPESELNVLASVYRFILFESSASKEGACPGAPDDAEESKNARTATAIIQED